jgi:hypothetical protein
LISQVFQQNEATAAHARVFLHVIDSSDNVSGKTGLTGTGQLSKNGAAGAATTNSLVEIDATNLPGDYYLELTATELNTLGLVVVNVKKTGALAAIGGGSVVPFDPYAVDKAGFALSTAGNDAIRDTIISDATPFPGADVALIKAKTDNLPAAPAAVSDVPTANANADALLDRADAIETGLTLRSALRLVGAACAGQASGLATTTAIFKSAVSALKNRITATVDADGNRTSITTDLT